MRNLPAVALLLAVALGPAAPSANAALKNTDCDSLQDTIDAAANGDDIAITESECIFLTPLTLPSNRSAPFALTIRGGGLGTILDGGEFDTRILTGDVTAPNVLDLTLKNLVFRHGSSPTEGGGALRLRGNVGATLDGVRFVHNQAGPNKSGGAALIESSRGGTTVVRNSAFGDGSLGSANTAGGGGGGLAVNNTGTSIEVTDSDFDLNAAGFGGGGLQLFTSSGGAITLDGNRVAHNAAATGGGGAEIVGTDVTLRNSSFDENSLGGGPAPSVDGGGLRVSAGGIGGASLSQFDNRFRDNTVAQGTGPNFGASGGGEAIAGFANITSRGDRLTNNGLPAPLGTGEAEGAGLAMEGCEALSTDVAQLRAESLAVAGNSAPGAVEGAGVYVGCELAPTALTLLDSTVSGNVANAQGSVGGVAGDGDDSLTLRNSIVTGNPGGADVAGFVSRTVTNSDACAAGGAAPLTGAGNICAAPKLVNSGPGAANVHQTAASPTRDRGSNLAVPAALELDYDGQRRILGPAVDMGVDEFVDRVRPALNGFVATPRRFVAGSGSTLLSFRLSEPARITFRVASVKPGRRVNGRCVKPTDANRKRPKCRRTAFRGVLAADRPAGPGSVRFNGRLGPGSTKLAPGDYRISAVATDLQGNRSLTRVVPVRVLTPPKG